MKKNAGKNTTENRGGGFMSVDPQNTALRKERLTRAAGHARRNISAEK